VSSRPAGSAATATEPTLLDRSWRVALFLAYRGLLVWWRVVRPRTFGVAVAVWSGGRVLLVRHSYKPGSAIPAGRPRRGESPAEAAVRELREEVAIHAAPTLLRPAARIVTRDLGKEDHLQVFELGLPEEPALAVDGREVVWASFRTRAEALELDLETAVRAYLEGSSAETVSTV